jgi:hypothetical protein|tara:strand:+ start:923 stop:1294 length:372 start_codon:yes stop_codon:yes gene_type:complete
MPKTVQKLDLGGICIDCGVDTFQYGYVNRVSADKSIWKQTTDDKYEEVLQIDGYLCGTCVGDGWEQEDGDGYTTDWDALEKYQGEFWYPHIDEDFPDARFWREAIANEDVELIRALHKEKNDA